VKVRVCKFDGCGRPAVTRGMCNAHYKRWWAAGKPTSEWDGGPPIGALPPKPCVDCGAVLHPVGRRQLRCEPCAAAAQKASQRQYRARVRAGKTVQRRCRVCGKAFEATDARRVTCGGECARERTLARKQLSVCKFDGCGRPVNSRSMCKPHYQRWRAAGRPTDWDGGPPVRTYGKAKGPCKFDGCGRPLKTRDMCSAHHKRWLAAGKPEDWDGGPPIGAMSPKQPEEHVDWDAFFQRLERNAGPRTAALARFELRRQRQLRAEVRA